MAACVYEGSSKSKIMGWFEGWEKTRCANFSYEISGLYAKTLAHAHAFS